ncbi:FecR domain-containing protein [Niveispirillum sp. BGYR6]|uniref:FecR family protein n=1 Tax=Niveispirillum sp. BGYR6 TaxID=2971249 RepID=UPI0022B98289|nr:FecR domain-containing protein [Niveispirillum sp. BGYR6]
MTGGDPILAQAAEWIVRLGDDDPAERAVAAREFAAWKAADPRHAAAAARMEAVLGRVQSLRGPSTARPALAALAAAGKPRGRRPLVAGATLVLALCLPLWAALFLWPPAYLLADLRTDKSEWQSRELADGTRITLSGNSAVNLHYDAESRRLELISGDILIDVAKDAARPFLVETAHGRIRALGTRFTVERRADETVVEMLESSTSITARQPVAGAAALTISAGQTAHISAEGVSQGTPVDPASLDDAWKRHQLVVSDQPLADVLDALSRHRRGRILYDRQQIAGLRVTAVLPLDDTDRALRLLHSSFPSLRLRTLTAYLVLVDAPP